MSKNHSIIILGILTAILPYLGFPQNFKTFLFVVFGLLIAFLAYKEGKEKIKPSQSDSFKENNSFNNEQSDSQSSFLK